MKDFTPTLISVNTETKNTDLLKAKRQLQLYTKLEKLVCNSVGYPQTDEDKETLLKNPLEHFNTKISNKYLKEFPIPIDINKLIDLMDLSPLQRQIETLQRNYTGKHLKSFKDGISININDEDYNLYTKNEAQNSKLKQITQLANILENISNEMQPSYMRRNRFHDALKAQLNITDGRLTPKPRYILSF